MKKGNIRALLMQVRADELTATEELNEFALHTGLSVSQFQTINAFQNSFSVQLDEFDVLFVGGSSDASVANIEAYPYLNPVVQLIQDCYHAHKPVFASCFGFQLAVCAFGGSVILDKANGEFGCHPLYLTASTKTDVLFEGFEDSFMAVCGHQERAKDLPEQFEILVTTEKCPIQAFKATDRLFYAFQFHPEMTKTSLLTRLARYADRYLEKDNRIQRIIDEAVEVDQANLILTRFIDLLVKT